MAGSLRISVCMATYNGAAYVAEQLGSIIEQLNPGDEVIIVDDCSTDTTLAEIDRAVAPSSELPVSITVLRNERNRGHVVSFERALLAATNDILVLSDQDDVWISGYLDKVRNIFKTEPGIGLVCARPIFCDENLTPVPQANGRYRHPRIGGALGVLAFLLNRSMPRGCTMSLRRAELAYMLPFPGRLLAHDHWIFATASVRRRMYSLDKEVILHRRHSAVLSRPRPLRQKISSRVFLVWQLLRRSVSRRKRDDAQLGSPW